VQNDYSAAQGRGLLVAYLTRFGLFVVREAERDDGWSLSDTRA
jgi:hypothetical protein